MRQEVSELFLWTKLAIAMALQPTRDQSPVLQLRDNSLVNSLRSLLPPSDRLTTSNPATA
jgi:hypothetical protein